MDENIENIDNEENAENVENTENAGTTDHQDRNLRKTRVGVVVSTKMQNTIVVQAVENRKHPRYSKIIKRTKKYMAHDQDNVCSEGDKVLIMETRPISKMKRWRLVEIIEKVK